MAYDEQADAQQTAPNQYQFKSYPTASVSGDPNKYFQLKDSPLLNMGGPYETSRATAQAAIRNRISEYRLAINQLEALSRALPIELPLPADEILRKLVLKGKTITIEY